MRKKLWFLIPIFVIIGVLPAQAVLAPILPYKTSKNTLKTDIVLEKVIACESGWNFNAIGKAGEIGLLQFMPATWILWTKKMNRDLDIYNPEHQIEVYRWAIRNGYAWHWTCWKKLFGIL